MRRKRHSILVAAIWVLGCAAPEPLSDDLLREAEQLCLEERFADAEPLLREHLRRDPMNAVAHYYLGRCYLSSDLINLAMARGEITVALALFQDGGQESPEGRFTDEYFELMCLTDIGKTYLSEIVLEIPHMKISAAEQVWKAKDRIARCEALYERAKRVNPDAHLTAWLRMRTAEVAAGMIAQ